MNTEHHMARMSQPQATLTLAGVLGALRFPDACDEEVSRQGEVRPCETTAVALRYDPTEGSPYPVCAYHARGEMVPLAVLAVAREVLQ